MRLLNTSTYELQDSEGTLDYAILSHRWFDTEITFQALDSVRLKKNDASTPQLKKIRGACAQAVNHGIDWIWIDSCCIDKSSSEEVSRSINSMLQWYQQARICYTYLSDVHDSKEKINTFHTASGSTSEWFTRGWTLQELLAPRRMRFFDSEWNMIGDRSDLVAPIASITGIDACYLTGEKDFRNASIATRLSWQANRRTTRIEDMAYSLIGILGVSLLPIYGEGREAFMRLQQILVNTQPDESLFAWTAPFGSLPSHNRSQSWSPDEWGLLAPSPDCFRDAGDISLGRDFRNRPPNGIASTREGVSFPMVSRELQSTTRWVVPLHFILPFSPVLIDRIRHRNRKVFAISLNCWRKDREGVPRPIQVYLSRDGKGDQTWRRCMCSELGLDGKMYQGSLSHTTRGITILQPSGVGWRNVD